MINKEFLYREYIIRGKSAKQIADKMNRGAKYIIAHLHKHNIPVRNISQSKKMPIAKQRMIQTNLKRYGVKNSFQLPQTAKTLQKKYGVNNIFQTPVVKQKIKKSRIQQGLTYTEKTFVKKAQKIHKNKYKYNFKNIKFINTTQKIEILCPYHGYFLQTPSAHLSRQGCSQCGVASSRLKLYDFKKRCNKKHHNRYNYSKVCMKSTQDKITVICPSHGEFIINAADHLYHGTGCGKCYFSKGEENVMSWLLEKNICFKREYTFEQCKFKDKLRFDFVIFEGKKIIAAIEYDGMHHFKQINNRKFKTNLKLIQKRDKIKNNYCKINNIPLLRIPYKQYNDISEILKNFFIKINH